MVLHSCYELILYIKFNAFFGFKCYNLIILMINAIHYYVFICHATDCSPAEVIISDMFMDEIISYDNFIIFYISFSSPFLYRLFIFEFNKFYIYRLSAS